MNKYQGSLDFVKKQFKLKYKVKELPTATAVADSFEELQELVDKEDPKKPVKDYSINAQFPMIKFNYVCPNCNKTLALNYDEVPNEYDYRCGWCGQVIDWSEVE